jgi:ubiquinone/menaquinone biosynthesis C-methylase UbiE
MTNSNTDQNTAQLFDSAAKGYANAYTDGSFSSYFFNRRLEIILNSLQDYKHAKVLDLGCGPGMMAAQCIEKGFEFFGVDISEKMIDECINRFGHLKSAHFSVGKLQKLDFPDAYFDVVFCMGALEYVDGDEIDNALSEMSRVLKPGGQIIVSLMSQHSFFAWHRRVRNSIKRLLGQEDDSESYDGLSRSFDEKNFCKLLRAKSLNDINTQYFGLNIYPYFLESRLPNRWRVKASKKLDGIVRGKLKWPYMAFIVKTRK